jgi:hypothetical protein
VTSQVPFTPLTPGAMERLTLDEALAFEAAACAVAGDQKPSLEVVATLVLTVQRLISESVPGAVTAERERIRQMAIRNNAVCVGDEGTNCYFADLIREEPGRG